MVSHFVYVCVAAHSPHDLIQITVWSSPFSFRYSVAVFENDKININIYERREGGVGGVPHPPFRKNIFA